MDRVVMSRCLMASAVFVLTASLAACGGGGGGGGSSYAPPTVTATLPPTAQSTGALSPSAPSTVTLAQIASGASGSITFPATASGSATATVTLAGANPTTVTPQSKRTFSLGGQVTPVAFMTVSLSAPITLNKTPGFSLTFPAGVLAGNVYVAFFDPSNASAGWSNVAGPVSPSGSTITFPSLTLAPPVTLAANTSYVFAIVETGTPLPTPTPIPTPTLTPTPIPNPSTTPTSVPLSSPVVPFTVSNGVARYTFAGGTSVAGAAIVSQGSDLGPLDKTVTFTTDTFNVGSGTQAQHAVVRVGLAAFGPRMEMQIRPVATMTHDVHPASNEFAEIALRATNHGALSSARRPLATTLPSGAALNSIANIWTEKFSIGSSTGTWVQVASTLVAQTANVNVYVDNTLLSGSLAVSSFQGGNLASTVAQLQTVAQNAYDSDTAHFGSPDYPVTAPGQGSANTCDSTGAVTGTGLALIPEPADKRVNFEILNSANVGKGVGGYFSAVNYLTQAYLNCAHGTSSGVPLYSNEAPMVYMAWYDQGDAGLYELKEDLVRGDSHEFQHLINFITHFVNHNGTANEDRFINEGLSVLSQDLAVNKLFPSVPFDLYDAVGYRANTFLANPANFSITGFIGNDPASFGEPANMFNCGGGCYGSAYLFQRYLYDRCGGDAYLAKMELGSGGTVGFPELQAACGGSETGQQLLTDFATAVALASANVAAPSARYSLGTLQLNHAYTGQIAGYTPVTVTAAVGSAATVNALGSVTVPVGGFGLVQFGPVPSGGLPVSITDTTPTGPFTLGGTFVQH